MFANRHTHKNEQNRNLLGGDWCSGSVPVDGGGLVVEEDISVAISPVARHPQTGTDDEQVSASHTNARCHWSNQTGDDRLVRRQSINY